MKNNKISFKRAILLFLSYTLLFIVIFSFLDYYDYYAINPILLTIIAVIIGVVLTVIHCKAKKRSRIDNLLDEL